MPEGNNIWDGSDFDAVDVGDESVQLFDDSAFVLVETGFCEIFRHGGGRKTAAELKTEFLGEIPIDPKVVIGGDEGQPIVVSDPESPAARAFFEFAERVVAQLEKASDEAKPEHPPVMPGKIEWE